MPSISDNLMIASRAIENALTAQSAQKISAKSQTSPHRRKEHHASEVSQKKSTDNINPDAVVEAELTKHIDLRA